MLNNFTEVFNTLISNCRNYSIPSVVSSIKFGVKGGKLSVKSTLGHNDLGDDDYYDASIFYSYDIATKVADVNGTSGLHLWEMLSETLYRLSDLIMQNCTNLSNNTVLVNNGTFVNEHASDHHDSDSIMGGNGTSFAAGFLTASCMVAVCFMLKQCIGLIKDRNGSHTSSNNQNTSGDLQRDPNTVVNDPEVVYSDNIHFVNAEVR